jgi:hypothetical protein
MLAQRVTVVLSIVSEKQAGFCHAVGITKKFLWNRRLLRKQRRGKNLESGSQKKYRLAPLPCLLTATAGPCSQSKLTFSHQLERQW